METISKRSVLIVDDSTMIRKRIREVVESIAHMEVISEADNGSDAVVLINITKPDFLILDIKMPRMSGIAVLESIQEYLADMCVIVLSNYADIEYKKKCFQLGAKYYLDKTKEIDRLNSLLQ